MNNSDVEEHNDKIINSSTEVKRGQTYSERFRKDHIRKEGNWAWHRFGNRFFKKWVSEISNVTIPNNHIILSMIFFFILFAYNINCIQSYFDFQLYFSVDSLEYESSDAMIRLQLALWARKEVQSVVVSNPRERALKNQALMYGDTLVSEMKKEVDKLKKTI